MLEPDDLPLSTRPYAEIPPRPQEQMLLDLLPDLAGERILCTSAGLAQFAFAAANTRPAAQVTVHYLDAYHAEHTRRVMEPVPPNLTIACSADFPESEVDLVALPLSARGEAELTRDVLQIGHARLAIGGQLVATTDNPRDQWLHEEMQKLFERVSRRPTDEGVAYIARKTRELKKLKNFACQFVFRDEDNLIQALSRPGVFAHRRVDPGARQLLSVMEVLAGDRVLDIGCGAGVLSLAAALRAADVTVHSVDSSPRAVECTLRGAELNDLSGIVTAAVNPSGDYLADGPFQLVVANPPYYANFRIAELFVRGGHAALETGGQILMVTKLPDWYAEHMPQLFEDVEIVETKDYYVVTGRK